MQGAGVVDYARVVYTLWVVVFLFMESKVMVMFMVMLMA